MQFENEEFESLIMFSYSDSWHQKEKNDSNYVVGF